MTLFDRFLKRSFGTPASVQSCLDGTVVSSLQFAPLCKAFRFASECYHQIRSSISSLLYGCLPFAVSGFVSLVVVFATDTHSRCWSRPHVGNESLERTSPLLTNCNSTASIISKSFVAGRLTSVYNPTPDDIFRISDSMPRTAMFGASCFCVFIAQAAARSNGMVNELISTNNMVVSALAVTKPSRPFSHVRRASDNCQAVKFTSSKIFEFRHRVTSTMVRDSPKVKRGAVAGDCDVRSNPSPTSCEIVT